MVFSSVVLIWFSGLVFVVFHSFTAAQVCKAWCYQHGLTEPKYRLLYSVVAVLSTAAWLFYVQQLPDAPFYAWDGTMQMLFWLIQAVGLLIALAAFSPIDGLVFLGLKKAKSGQDPFVVQGVYRWMRHPMYMGAMLILLAMPEQTWNGFHFTLVICLYFILGSRLEERRMLAEHPDYADYQQQVAAFIPKIRR
ncbi:MAG: isoprenylcysteine carboxylmethyltransferase family protein [Mariprofundaceae bacterium]|nr:isoprenylcysteine carboxylmethyltransferase family protein [Mariprofundaceae bacterium]